MTRKTFFLFAVLALHGCGPATKPSPRPSESTADAPAPAFKPTATIKELMDSTVDPAADGLWDSVRTTSTKAGVDKREPRTDEEWHAVRRHAITLIEAMNLLTMEGRHAAPAGTKPGLGELAPAQIDAMIRANRPEFNQFAAGVRDETLNALKAIDRKDVKELFRVGSDIDSRCEGCHVTFWYPNSARPSS